MQPIDISRPLIRILEELFPLCIVWPTLPQLDYRKINWINILSTITWLPQFHPWRLLPLTQIWCCAVDRKLVYKCLSGMKFIRIFSCIIFTSAKESILFFAMLIIKIYDKRVFTFPLTTAGSVPWTLMVWTTSQISFPALISISTQDFSVYFPFSVTFQVRRAKF